jgi:hypothetical protein
MRRQCKIFFIAMLAPVVMQLVTPALSASAEIEMCDEQSRLYRIGIKYFDTICDETNGAAGDGDCTDVMGAKNAEKTSPPVDMSNGGDKNVSKVIDTYGELAYRTGKKYSIPYLAVILQGRYENSDGINGNDEVSNNFWGIHSNYPPAGSGKETKKVGVYAGWDNLGKGFDGYGSYITKSGLYSKALKETDPLKYIKALADTGYFAEGSYAAFNDGSMKKTYDAYKKYIDDNDLESEWSSCGGGATIGDIAFPLGIKYGDITTNGNEWTHTYHENACPTYYALDLMFKQVSVAKKVKVLAMHDGVVRGLFSANKGGIGVVVHDTDNRNWGHLHIAKAEVKEGQKVKKEQVIGTGVVDANGYHLHVDLSVGKNRPAACSSCTPADCPLEGEFLPELRPKLKEIYETKIKKGESD